jgi:hypothetical protein
VSTFINFNLAIENYFEKLQTQQEKKPEEKQVEESEEESEEERPRTKKYSGPVEAAIKYIMTETGICSQCIINTNSGCNKMKAKTVVFNYNKIELSKFVKRAVDKLFTFKDVCTCFWYGNSQRPPLSSHVTTAIESKYFHCWLSDIVDVTLDLFGDCDPSDIVTAGNNKVTLFLFYILPSCSAMTLGITT